MWIMTQNRSRLDLRLEGVDFVKSPESAEHCHAVQCLSPTVFVCAMGQTDRPYRETS